MRPPTDAELDETAMQVRARLEHLIAHIPEDDPAFMDIPRFDKGSVGRPRTREGASFPTEQVQP